MNRRDLIVVGGGAAGVFAAICAKTQNPSAQVTLLEKSAVLLSKVRVSGGGRCNVTHSCFDPKQLSGNYPRGARELVGPFHTFQPRDTIDWFESRGVKLKTESDGRIFPVSDRSETIIECLLNEAKTLGVEILLRHRIQSIAKTEEGFELLVNEEKFVCKHLLLATGSGADGHAWAQQLGHTIQAPVPSLFTFNVPTSPLKELSGVAVKSAELKIRGTTLSQRGPLLITHFGFSGPAALKLSAWGARDLYEKGYKVELAINWLPDLSQEEALAHLVKFKRDFPQKNLDTESPFHLPKNLWKALIEQQENELLFRRLSDIPNKELQNLAAKLHEDIYQVDGKTTNKEEFVTCGGVTLKEVNFKTMESKICPGLFFAGEILDIDGITGGFNFQNAWTTAFLAGQAAL
ncbi:MAG: NAD(P)/FAD-dependent oxidoreductase [Chlamydiales bacterium]|nr:NAD(P)/FAD-dependent oxidoreductase [Chlamydiales bacterium]